MNEEQKLNIIHSYMENIGKELVSWDYDPAGSVLFPLSNDKILCFYICENAFLSRNEILSYLEYKDLKGDEIFIQKKINITFDMNKDLPAIQIALSELLLEKDKLDSKPKEKRIPSNIEIIGEREYLSNLLEELLGYNDIDSSKSLLEPFFCEEELRVILYQTIHLMSLGYEFIAFEKDILEGDIRNCTLSVQKDEHAEDDLEELIHPYLLETIGSQFTICEATSELEIFDHGQPQIYKISFTLDNEV